MKEKVRMLKKILQIKRRGFYMLIVAVALLACAAGGKYLYGLQFTPEHIVSTCEHAEYPLVCFNDRINSVMRHLGLAAAFDVLAAAYAADPAFAASCHGNTHDLGREAYEEYHRAGAIELTPKASYCGYGFYHGFMEALLAETHDLAEARSFCSFAARQVPIPYGFSEGACYHGIGHGVTDGTIPSQWGSASAMGAPGLALCSQVALTDVLLYRCYSGVFNSLAIMYWKPLYELDAGNDPYALCRTKGYSNLEKEACYAEMNTLAVLMAQKNLAGTLAYTYRIADAHYRAIAVKSAAAFYVKVSPSGVGHLPTSDLRTCETLSAGFEADCIAGLMDGVWEYGSPGTQYVQATTLCGSEDLSESIAKMCFRRVQESVDYFYAPDVIPHICSLVPDRFRIAPCTLKPTV